MDNLMQVLSETDIKHIKAWMHYCGGDESDCLGVVDVEGALKGWNAEKGTLYKLLGNNLVVEREVNVQKSSDMLETDIWDALLSYDSKSNFASMWSTMVSGIRYGNFCSWFYEEHPDLKNFVKENYINDPDDVLYNLGGCLSDLMSSRYLATNIYPDDSFTVPSIIPGKRDLKINKGCKTIKAIGKIVDFWGLDKELFEEFRLIHSLCLNQKVLKGTLCLSIHPLDYMTMSDNSYGWSSCMSWCDCGDYRQGTLEMMGSPYVIIAYLKGEEPFIPDSYIDGFEWTDKKWRQLFVVHPELLLGIKSYPYQSDALTTTALSILRELAVQNCGWNFNDTISKINNRSRNTIATADALTVYVELNMHHMYNDIGIDHFAYVNPAINKEFYLNLSGVAYCLSCGRPLEYECESSLLCSDCGTCGVCDNCGYHTDDLISMGDSFLCCDCYYEETSECPKCGNRDWNDNFQSIYLRSGLKGLSVMTSICDCCVDEGDIEDILGPIETFEYNSGYWNRRRDFVDVKNISKENIQQYFGIYDMETLNKSFNDPTCSYDITPVEQNIY